MFFLLQSWWVSLLYRNDSRFSYERLFKVFQSLLSSGAEVQDSYPMWFPKSALNSIVEHFEPRRHLKDLSEWAAMLRRHGSHMTSYDRHSLYLIKKHPFGAAIFLAFGSDVNNYADPWDGPLFAAIFCVSEIS